MTIKKIGILDFGVRPSSNLRHEICFQVIKEAVLAEKLGFSRVWYTEHYGPISNGWMSADVMVSLSAAYTSTIKIGIAGSSIEYYQPLKIALDYKLLSSIFPDRIDLGFSKGIIPEIYQDLFGRFENADNKDNNRNRRELVRQKIDLCINLLNEKEIILSSQKTVKPQLWNLVASSEGYLQSLNFGINCSRSLFHGTQNLEPDVNKLLEYKELFFKKFGVYPEVNLAIAGTCQNTAKSCVDIIEYIRNKKLYSINLEKAVYGSPNEVFDKLSLYAETYEVEEIIFVELGLTDKQRKNSLKNISQRFSLK